MKKLLFTLCFLSLLFGCSDSNNILNGHNFNKGNWLLVNVDYAKNTLQLISDKDILNKNQNGIWVSPAAECGGTTCDGFIKLFKNGELIAENEYLTRSAIFESSEIESAYVDAKEWTINPRNDTKFKIIWDSLLKAGNYPTVYYKISEDKNIIWVYNVEK